MHTALAILLKSKKPLPVTVIAQSIAKMVMRTKAILTIFKMVFFKSSHSFVKFRFIPLPHAYIALLPPQVPATHDNNFPSTLPVPALLTLLNPPPRCPQATLLLLVIPA